MNKGKLVVFEGADGSGKTTQSKLLLEYLKERKIPSEYISFPRYQDSLWGKMVRRFLNGEFGKINEVDPYFASLAYAGDRMTAKVQMKKWLEEGKIIVCNRYIGSNIGHMAAKIKDEGSRIKYIKWLEDLEYIENGIPKEDLVILLQVPIGTSRKLMKGRVLDIHERDQKYLKEVYWVYDYVAGLKKNWVKVDCTENGEILPAKKIHERVLGVLRKRQII